MQRRWSSLASCILWLVVAFSIVGQMLGCSGRGGCNSVREQAVQAKITVKKKWSILLKKVGLSRAASEEPESESGLSVEAQAELLHEMFTVVLQREPVDVSEFVGYREAMEQGASLEGIYNGFTHSAAYRNLESERKGASDQAIAAFSEEMSLFQTDLPEVSSFSAQSAEPLARAIDPAQAEGRGAGGAASQAPLINKNMTQDQMTEAFAKLFAGASIFTLKRVLGDEAMKVVEFKKKRRADLAKWYAVWAVRAAGLGVDFGLSLRNKADEGFHFYWAMSASEDRLRWEALNRVHRLINEKNRKLGA